MKIFAPTKQALVLGGVLLSFAASGLADPVKIDIDAEDQAAAKKKAAAPVVQAKEQKKEATAKAAVVDGKEGTILGGPLGDRIGRKRGIWFSILGAAPFSLLVPYANLAGTVALTFLAGMILASAFSAIVVYAQELLPGRVGMVSGLIFGFAFGVGGMGAGLLGQLADHYGIETVYRLCAWLPLLGVCAVLLPDLRRHAARH